MAEGKVIDRDRGWKGILKAVEAMKDNASFAKVGVLADTPKGEAREAKGDLTVAEVAVINEYGTEDGHQPARPFVRPTFDARIEHNVHMARHFFGEILEGKVSLGQALGAMGAGLAADIKNYVTNGPHIPPPNAPSTALAKAMKGKTAHAFAQKKQRNVGDALADAATTQYAEGLGGHGRGGRKAVGAARTLAGAFAQIAALANVRPLVDTSRMINAVTHVVVLSSFAQGLAGGGGKE